MNGRYDAVIFDLDGTLADTLADIWHVGNRMLVHFGLPEYPLERYRYLAGQGARWLVETALGPANAGLVEPALAYFKRYQLEHGAALAKPYEGVPGMLDGLARRRMPMAVLSNKPHHATVDLVGRLFAPWSFASVGGAKDGGPLKPDPAGALAIAEAWSLPPQRVLYVGDTAVDMQTAARAGMPSVGVLWGFRDEPELREHGAQTLIRHPGELLGLLSCRR